MGRSKSSNQLRQGTGPSQSPGATARSRPDRRMNFPDMPHSPGGYTGTVVCPRCHAIYNDKHWHFDEAEYERLRDAPDVNAVICPADEKIEREEYDGFVTLKSSLIPKNEEAVLGLIYNTEKHIQANNPMARIAKLSVDGDTIEVHTISTFLAERIGKELGKAYHGELDIKPSPREQFIRVSWYRE